VPFRVPNLFWENGRKLSSDALYQAVLCEVSERKSTVF
jgi:hypothetical protein